MATDTTIYVSGVKISAPQPHETIVIDGIRVTSYDPPDGVPADHEVWNLARAREHANSVRGQLGEFFLFRADIAALKLELAASGINTVTRYGYHATATKPLTPAGCVCGAAALGHKGRGAGHSSWCDMAKTGGA